MGFMIVVAVVSLTARESDPISKSPPSDKPLILHHDKTINQSLIIEDGSVKRITPDNKPGQSLLQIRAEEAFYWKNGNTLLLAKPLTITPEQGHPGEWYAFELDPDNRLFLQPVKLKDYNADPRKIVTVTLARDPHLFFFVEDHPNGYHMESWYDPATGRFNAVQVMMSAGEEAYSSAQYERNRPTPSEEPGYFQEERSYPLSNGNRVYTYTDSHGTLVYYSSELGNQVFRYVEQQVRQIALKTDFHGQSIPVLHIDDRNDYLSLPTMDFGSYFPSLPELLDMDWQIVDVHNFYKIAANRLEMVHFKQQYEQDDREPIRSSIDLPSLATDQHNGLLTIGSSSSAQYLSIYDAINSQAPFLMRDLPAQVVEVMDGQRIEDWRQNDEDRLPGEIIEAVWSNEPTPQEVDEAISRHPSGCISECGDAAIFVQTRKIDGTWYVLSGTTFYQVKDQQLVELGNLPITTASTIGEGANLYAALDYGKFGQHWYVADTYGNRVIKLNEQLEIEAEYPLPMPNRVKPGDDGAIEVSALNGITVLDDQLILKQTKAEKPQSINSTAPTEHLFFDVSHYSDEKTGMHWVYIYDGQLVLYDSRKAQYQILYVGNPVNGQALVKVLPYRDEVIVLLDNLLHRFTRDGRWIKSIEFPRGIPDGIYDSTPKGENSHVLDAAHGKIYLVQGFRVICIDLNDNTAYPIFEQLYSDIGTIILYKDHLVFSMEGHHVYRPEEITLHSNELIVIPVDSGNPQRYRLESGWVSNGFVEQSEERLSLWAFADLNNRNSNLLKFGTLSLDEVLASIPVLSSKPWSLTSSEMEERYDQFSVTKNEELLKGLTPLDIFKFYVKASEAGDYETLYALYIKDSDYDVPSFKTYINDISRDQEVLDRTKRMWKQLKQSYELTEELNGDHALIRISNGNGNKEDEKGFQLIKNRDGIWKAAWMPMQ